MHSFDPTTYLLELYNNTAPSMPELEPGKLVSWQQKLRATVADLLGGFPSEHCELQVHEDEPEDMGWYRRTRVVLTSRPGMDVLAYYLTPVGIRPSGATIICVHGHGAGVTSLIGLDPDGAPREEFSGLHKDYALRSVEHGHNVLAVEQVCFGCRRERRAVDSGPEAWSCDPVSGAALLLGQTTLGWRVYDVMRCLDYLSGRADVDPSRIGCIGLSGGGTTALFSAALDQRIKATVVSGYFNTFRDSVMAVPHCICNYVPGILRHAEMYHIAGLVAPRALFIESAVRDPIFPSEATQRAFVDAKAIFDTLDAGDRIALDVFEGEHEFHGGPCFDFLMERL